VPSDGCGLDPGADREIFHAGIRSRSSKNFPHDGLRARNQRAKRRGPIVVGDERAIAALNVHSQRIPVKDGVRRVSGEAGADELERQPLKQRADLETGRLPEARPPALRSQRRFQFVPDMGDGIRQLPIPHQEPRDFLDRV